MFITKRQADRLTLEYESIKSLILSIYNNIAYCNDSRFETIVIYTIMHMQDIESLANTSKELTSRIFLYNDSVLRARSSIKIGHVELPPIIII